MTNRIDPTLLRKSIYQSAIFGQLVAQNPEDGDASILLKEAERQKSLDIKSGIYKEKSFGKTAINEADFEDMPELPAGWIHCYLGQLIHLTSGVDLDSDSYSPENIGIPYITGASNFQSGVLLINRFTKAENQNSFHGEILLTCKGTIGEIAINTIGACHVARQVMAIKPYISDEFLIVLLKANVAKLSSQAKSLIPGISRDNILNLPIALPPLKEQQRIVEKIKLLEPLMAEYEALRERESNLNESLFSELLTSILASLFSPLYEDKSVVKKRLGDIMEIERGGSPRPISSFLTEKSDGVNWIKIGDAPIGSKYITSTKEKITPEGVKRSRMVFPGDFIISNSMSFGRPYILETTGCIHDGWVVLRKPSKFFDINFLFWLISSPQVKKQFSDSAGGAVVKNLNIEKIKNTLVPIPSGEKQLQIAYQAEGYARLLTNV